MSEIARLRAVTHAQHAELLQLRGAIARVREAWVEPDPEWPGMPDELLDAVRALIETRQAS